jgi:hypothetical protein
MMKNSSITTISVAAPRCAVWRDLLEWACGFIAGSQLAGQASPLGASEDSSRSSLRSRVETSSDRVTALLLRERPLMAITTSRTRTLGQQLVVPSEQSAGRGDRRCIAVGRLGPRAARRADREAGDFHGAAVGQVLPARRAAPAAKSDWQAQHAAVAVELTEGLGPGAPAVTYCTVLFVASISTVL